MKILYEKVMVGKKTTYVPVPLQSAKLDEGMTQAEIVTAVASLAVLAINGYQQMLPPKSCSVNRINSVQESVLRMFKDTGCRLDNKIVAHVCSVWDQTMQRLDGTI